MNRWKLFKFFCFFFWTPTGGSNPPTGHGFRLAGVRECLGWAVRNAMGCRARTSAGILKTKEKDPVY